MPRTARPSLTAAPGAARSFAWCERLARRSAANFYHAFRILPSEQRRAMCALYAFMRVADDVTDGPGTPAAKRGPLEAWRRQLGEALTGKYHHPLHPALHATLTHYRIPPALLEAVLDGVAMDLDTASYDTFADLYQYCYRVASAVGLSCIRIWGNSSAQAEPYAEAAGIAFQLTNILRDLGEDAERGRVYLPREDLERFRYDAGDLRAGRLDDRFRALMSFQTQRAYAYYDGAAPLAALLAPPGRAVYLVMQRTYRGLLDAIVRRDFDVFSGRVRLSSLHKFWLAASALPIRWGLL